ncbi:MAG: hypothetical protein ABIN68_07110 [Sphingomicrobium sp.]
MKAVSKILASGVAIAALASAAPAAAQYYPGSGYGSGNVVGQVLNQVLGGSQYGNGYGYGNNSQASVQRCAAAVTQRINRDYGYGAGGYGAGGYGGGYGGYGGYANNGYAAGNARVLGVTSIERRSNNGLRIRGVATANAYGASGYGGQYGGGYGGYGGYSGGYAPQQTGELSFKCNVDYRGYITDIDLNRSTYSNYGYRRY